MKKSELIQLIKEEIQTITNTDEGLGYAVLVDGRFYKNKTFKTKQAATAYKTSEIKTILLKLPGVEKPKPSSGDTWYGTYPKYKKNEIEEAKELLEKLENSKIVELTYKEI